VSGLALVTTTIQVPEVLARYRAIGPDVPFFVTGDRQSPHDDIRRFCDSLGNAVYYSVAEQEQLGYACSNLIGWKTTGRRNLAMLEAARRGADAIVMIDDDNIPVDGRYFTALEEALLGAPFSGLELAGDGGWADPGALMVPPVRHRGFPHELWHPVKPPVFGHASGVRAGVAAGLWLGDPDVDAVTRIASQPSCMGVSAVADAGCVLRPGTYAPFNSQNTAFRTELLPVMVMQSPALRYDDIWASFTAERVMRECGWAVRYGQPYVWQQRNAHRLSRDLSRELRGMSETLAFCAALDEAQIPGGADAADAARAVFMHLARGSRWEDIGNLGLTWQGDVKKAMA
jgi:hypothetical protein